jgi:hypothetical protein
MGRKPRTDNQPGTSKAGLVAFALVCLPAAVSLALLVGTIRASSATYDEVAYLRVAARWWRTGQAVEITRMGSPLSFWKLQQAPVLWGLDRMGRGALIDEPIRHQAELLPLVRSGALWIWLAALGLTAWWARRLYGVRAMVLAAWLFALSPNLLAHGALVTMELPIVACTIAMLFFFWTFLNSGAWRWFWASAAVCGLAFSCKYTAIVFPPILTVGWWIQRGRAAPWTVMGLWKHTRRVALGMVGYVLVMLLADFAITGFAVMPLSHSQGDHPSIAASFGPTLGQLMNRFYETPIPQDLVGFATQVHHQMSGGASYLLGERRMSGWRYYYIVALAVKVPLAFWLLLGARFPLEWKAKGEERPILRDDLLPLSIALYLAITAAGSSRNYGFRYLLPLAPLAIIWVSRLAESARPVGRSSLIGGWRRWIIGLGLAGQALAVAGIHPFELTYFNALAGGPLGGRRILSDSNLDWGQGLRCLARLQREDPEFRDLTLYYFGDTEPRWYGVQGVAHVVNAVDDHSGLPPISTASTRYLAVSASLQWGPWGPPCFFRDLEGLEPVRMTDDTTIAIFRAADLRPIAAIQDSTNSRFHR